MPMIDVYNPYHFYDSISITINVVGKLTISSCLNSRVPDLSHLPATWWWCGWHDDVVDMTVGMLPLTLVRNSEVV